MQLTYNGVRIDQLGVLRMLGRTVTREPAEAPQRERWTYRWRLDIFEESFADSATQIDQLREALKTQNATMLWAEPAGHVYCNRTVIASADDEPEDGRRVSGTKGQAITFSFWYYDNAVISNCLTAVYQRQIPGQGPALSLGQVERWQEKNDTALFDKQHDVRKLVQGTVTCSGKYAADTSQALASRQASLLAAKDAMMSELAAGARGSFTFGSFNQQVRVTGFTAEVDQPANYLGWTLTAVYTIYPNEATYFSVEYSLAAKFSNMEGITRLTLSGKIDAATLAVAQGKLALIAAAVAPAGYVQETNNTTPMTGDSGTLSGASPGGDGAAFLSLSFELGWRDQATLGMTYQRTGPGTPLLNLGVTDHFSDRYAGSQYNAMRSNRSRGGGTVTASGRIWRPDTENLAAKRTALAATKTQLDAEINGGDDGTLTYPGFFGKTVRIVDWDCQVDRAYNSLGWSLTASYTRYPNEADYALCEFKVQTRQDRENGTAHLQLSGRIGAPTEAAALNKLIRLRAAIVPAGYVLKSDQHETSQVDDEQNLQSGPGNTSDGKAFWELSFNDDWQAAEGAILQWKLNVTSNDDVKTGYIRTSYHGMVQASGPDQASAQSAALAEAAALGANQLPFPVRDDVNIMTPLVQTDGAALVTVEFTYEYQGKGPRIFVQMTSELSQETFGVNTEAVSGVIAAPDLATALGAYNTYVRGLATYQNSLVLNEHYPEASNEQVYQAGSGLSQSMDSVFRFSFTVQRIKGLTQAGAKYVMKTQMDILNNKLVTTVEGTAYAMDSDTAQGFWSTLFGGLSLGSHVRSDRGNAYHQGLSAGGSQQGMFVAMDFTDVYEAVLSGAAAVLESEVTEDVLYSGKRNVEKPIPDGPSIIQQVGTTAATRQVSAMAKGTNETAARAYVVSCQTLLASYTSQNGPGAFMHPPRIQTKFLNLPLTSGVPRSGGQDTTIVQVTGTFSEIMPVLSLTG